MATSFPLSLYLLFGLIVVGGANARPVYRTRNRASRAAGTGISLAALPRILALGVKRVLRLWPWAVLLVALGCYLALAQNHQLPVTGFNCSSAITLS